MPGTEVAWARNKSALVAYRGGGWYALYKLKCRVGGGTCLAPVLKTRSRASALYQLDRRLY